MGRSNDPPITPDLGGARRFLELLDPDACFTFQTFPERGRGGVARTFHGTLNQHFNALVALNAQGAAICVMVNAGDGVIHDGQATCRTEKNVICVRALFLDLDGVDVSPVLAATPHPDIVVESSPGHWHCYWRVRDCALHHFTPAQLDLSAKFGGDPKVNDLPRIMRLPGFIHQKGAPFLTRLVHPISDKNLNPPDEPPTLNELRASLGLTVEAKLSTGTRGQALIPRLTLPGERARIDVGGRNSYLTSLAGALRRQGAGEATIVDALNAANQNEITEPLEDTEVQQIAHSIAKYQPTQPYDVLTTLNDKGNADRLAAAHGDDIRYVPSRQQWLIWTGRCWHPDVENGIMEFAKATAGKIFDEAKACPDLALQKLISRHASNSHQERSLRAMIALATSIPQLIVNESDLDGDDLLLGVENGVIDLRTGQIRPHQRADLMTRLAPVTYDSAATCPTFLAFLNTVTNSDAELCAYLQRLMGYCMTGSTREQVFFFLHGVGANGKSTFLNVLRELLGSAYAKQSPYDTFTFKKYGRSATNDLARLRGTRVTATTEIEDGTFLDESLIKQITGEDIVTARELYKEFGEFQPKFKLLIAGNHKPVIRGDDTGIWRRVQLVPFTVTIREAQRDQQLAEKLRAELPGILNFALAGCSEWQKRGLAPPKSVTDAVAEYRGDMDVLGKWMEDSCDVGERRSVEAGDAYMSYGNWCFANGHKKMTSTKFGRKLGERFAKTRSPRGTVVYLGFDRKKDPGLEHVRRGSGDDLEETV